MVAGFSQKKLGYFKNIFFSIENKIKLKSTLYILTHDKIKSEKAWIFKIKRKFLSKNFTTLRTKIIVF